MKIKLLTTILILMSWQIAEISELFAESPSEKTDSIADAKLGLVYSGLWEGWKITSGDQSWPMTSLVKSSWNWFLEIVGGAVFAYGSFQYLSTDRNSSRDLLSGFEMLGGAVATLSGAFLFANGTHDLSLAVEEYNHTLDGRTSN